jgi:hypothetical protein
VTALLEAVTATVNSANERNEIFLRNAFGGHQSVPAKTFGIIYHSRLILQDSTSLMPHISNTYNMLAR